MLIRSDLLGLNGGIEVENLRSATKLQTVESGILGEPSTMTLFKPLVSGDYLALPDKLREDSSVRGDLLSAEDLLRLTAKIPLTNLLTTPENQVGTIGSNLAGINAPAEGGTVETTTGPETITADAQPTFSRNTLVFGLVILLIAGFLFFGRK